MAQKAIGANFANELKAAGLLGLPFSWHNDGTIEFDAAMTDAQKAAVNAAYASHDPAKADPTAQAAAAFTAGIVITSASASAIDGTYAIDEAAQQKITSEQVYIATTGKFTNGQTSRGWKDAAGALHVFPDVAHFTAFAEAVAELVDTIYAAEEAALAGGARATPSNAAAIA